MSAPFCHGAGRFSTLSPGPKIGVHFTTLTSNFYDEGVTLDVRTTNAGDAIPNPDISLINEGNFRTKRLAVVMDRIDDGSQEGVAGNTVPPRTVTFSENDNSSMDRTILGSIGGNVEVTYRNPALGTEPDPVSEEICNEEVRRKIKLNLILLEGAGFERDEIDDRFIPHIRSVWAQVCVEIEIIPPPQDEEDPESLVRVVKSPAVALLNPKLSGREWRFPDESEGRRQFVRYAFSDELKAAIEADDNNNRGRERAPEEIDVYFVGKRDEIVIPGVSAPTGGVAISGADLLVTEIPTGAPTVDDILSTTSEETRFWNKIFLFDARTDPNDPETRSVNARSLAHELVHIVLLVSNEGERGGVNLFSGSPVRDVRSLLRKRFADEALFRLLISGGNDPVIIEE